MDEPTEPSAAGGAGEVTRLLSAWSAGDPEAFGRLLPIVYAELRAIAGQVFRRERGAHTLQPTAVVHEAVLKLARGAPLSLQDRAHFFAVTSQAMRQVLVDHARARKTAKRGGGATRLEVSDDLDGASGGAVGMSAVDVLAVDEVVDRLAALDREQARVVELRFFGGLSVEETALVLAVSEATVKRTWRLARAFLYRELAASRALP